MPRTQQETTAVKIGFMAIGNIPNVIGAIDGTLIPIRSVNGNEEHLYVCRKNFHAINTQAVCDAELRYACKTCYLYKLKMNNNEFHENGCLYSINCFC